MAFAMPDFRFRRFGENEAGRAPKGIRPATGKKFSYSVLIAGKGKFRR